MADDAPGVANRDRGASAVHDDVRLSKYRAAFAELE